MDPYSRTHLGDDELLRGAHLHASHERTSTSVLLADLGEIEARKLHVAAGYPALVTFCMDALKLSEDAAQRRIHAARAARRFPVMFHMCADGRLSLTTINQLAPHLTESNAYDLLAAAAGRSKGEVAELLAALRPSSELLGWVEALPVAAESPAPARANERVQDAGLRPSAADAPAPARVAPIAARRFAVQCTVGDAARDALQFAQDTTGRDVSTIVEAAVLLYAEMLRKRKCGATERPSTVPRPTRAERHVPHHVRRIVWERDGGQCTFTSADGHLCGSRRRLEFDHVVPVARGGEATVDNVRLRCRSHNQLEAERAFGAAFMASKREAAQRAADELRRRAERDVVPALLALGYRKSQALYAASFCEALPDDATLEQRVKHALRQLLPAHRRVAPACASAGAHV